MNRSMTAAACAAAGLMVAFPAAAACSLKTQPIPIKMIGADPGKSNGAPTVDVKVNGKIGHFLIDSSSAVNQISTKFASSQKLPSTKAANAEIFTSPKFEFAGAGMDNAQFIGSSRQDADGVIGQTILGLMDVEYDLAGGQGDAGQGRRLRGLQHGLLGQGHRPHLGDAAGGPEQRCSPHPDR